MAGGAQHGPLGAACGSCSVGCPSDPARNPLGLLAPLIAGVLAIVTFRILNMGLFAGYRSLRFGHPFFSDWGLNVIANWPSQLLSLRHSQSLRPFSRHGWGPSRGS